MNLRCKYILSNVIVFSLICFFSLYAANKYLSLYEKNKRVNEISHHLDYLTHTYLHEELLGAVRMIGLGFESLVQDLNNKVKDGKVVLRPFKFIQEQYGADIVYVMDETGTVMASQYAPGKTLTGNNYAFREYFIRGMRGETYVYPALGVTSRKRGIYFSAPVYNKNNIIGVFVIKMGVELVDQYFSKIKKMNVLLVTPKGFIFSGNMPKYLYYKALQLNKSEGEAFKTQFGLNKEQSYDSFPADLNQKSIELDGKKYLVDKKIVPIIGTAGEAWTLFFLSEQKIFENWGIFVLINIICFIIFLLTSGLFCIYLKGKQYQKDKMRIDLELKEKSHLLTSAIESISHPFFVIDANHLTVKISNGAGDSLGIVSEDGVISLDSDENKLNVKHLNEVRNLKKSLIVEYEKINVEGGHHHYEVYCSPVIRENDHIVSDIIIHFIDISKRLKDFLEKEKINQQLFQASKMASIGDFAAGMSHEINNPLTVVRGYIEIILKKFKGKTLELEELENYVNIVKESILKISGIINGLKVYSRNDPDHTCEADIKYLLEETLNLVSNIFEKEGVNISFHNVSDQHLVYGKIGRLQQVFMCMLSNAKEAILDVKKTGNISINLYNHDNKLLIDIIDDGHGIKVDHLARIFDPFFTTKDPNRGTGLGLSMSYEIIKSFNGDIIVKSEENKGSTFTISLPLSHSYNQKSK